MSRPGEPLLLGLVGHHGFLWSTNTHMDTPYAQVGVRYTAVHIGTHRHRNSQARRGTRKHTGVHTSKDALRHVSVCT